MHSKTGEEIREIRGQPLALRRRADRVFDAPVAVEVSRQESADSIIVGKEDPFRNPLLTRTLSGEGPDEIRSRLPKKNGLHVGSSGVAPDRRAVSESPPDVRAHPIDERRMCVANRDRISRSLRGEEAEAVGIVLS